MGIITLIATVAAQAGFESWTSEREDDPFSGGTRISIEYQSSIRSGVYITCDTAGDGLLVRIIPGYDYEFRFSEFQPVVEFAIDGARILSTQGATNSVGNTLTAIDAGLPHRDAITFVRAFASANRQVAIQDGLTDRPHLLKASGSTNSGKQLLSCLDQQERPSAPEPAAIPETASGPKWNGLSSAQAIAETLDAVWRGIFDAESVPYSSPSIIEGEGPTRVVFRSRDVEYIPETNTLKLSGAFPSGPKEVSNLAYRTAEILIAKGYAKHIQNLVGITTKFREIVVAGDDASTKSIARRMSVQEACFAGIWYHFAAAEKLDDRHIDLVFRRHDNDELSDAESRARWFRTGAKSGKLADCDTFNNPI